MLTRHEFGRVKDKDVLLNPHVAVLHCKTRSAQL